MRGLLSLAILLSLAACATPNITITDPAALQRGATSYGVRCMGCHEPATPGAPDRMALGKMKAGRIYQALTSGKMELMAIDLPDAEAREIAAWLAAKPPA